MSSLSAGRRRIPYQFVLDELEPIRPRIKSAFGVTYAYLRTKLLLGLRYSTKQTNCNGVWVFTHTEHIQGLRQDFPLLRGNYFWKSGPNGWMILAEKTESFEEYAFKVCEMILQGDQRIGRLTRGSLASDTWISR